MESLVVLGAQNANVDDRFLDRKEIKTVQYFEEGKFHELTFFHDFGSLGVPSLCWDKHNKNILYFTTGDELYELDFTTKRCQKLNLQFLRDVHEIDCIDGKIWLSNTYYDELVAFDIESKSEWKRTRLQPKDANGENRLDVSGRGEFKFKEGQKNKFHTNQVFKGYDGSLYALIHHINGEQLFHRVAQKLIKKQGNGGVLNLANGKTHKLSLKAPHSVRLINNEYWVFDSGHAQLNVYNQAWEMTREIPMAGWGRGGVYHTEEKRFYAGVSAKRKRYLSFNEENKQKNLVQVFSANYNIVDEFEVPNVEQVNNLYFLDKEQLEAIKLMNK